MACNITARCSAQIGVQGAIKPTFAALACAHRGRRPQLRTLLRQASPHPSARAPAALRRPPRPPARRYACASPLARLRPRRLPPATQRGARARVSAACVAHGARRLTRFCVERPAQSDASRVAHAPAATAASAPPASAPPASRSVCCGCRRPSSAQAAAAACSAATMPTATCTTRRQRREAARQP